MAEPFNLVSYPNEYQQIFIVSFSVLYGIMLQNAMGLGLYHFAQKSLVSYTRIFLAFIFINFGPFASFAYVYTLLSTINRTIGFWQIMGIFMISLIVFFWFRILHLIVYVGRSRLYPSWIFSKYNEKFSTVTRRLDDMGTSIPGHIFAFLVYLIIAGIGWLLLL